MTRHIRNIILAFWWLGLWAALAANPIQQMALNPLTVLRIPVATDRLTTIRFPSPISDLEGATIASEPAPGASFLVSFRPGSSFFSVRALGRKQATTVNVVWQEQTFVLELVESNEPWLSLVLTSPEPRAAKTTAHSVTPTRLVGLLDTAKAYPVLKQQHPEAVADIECLRTNTCNDYGDYTITTEEIFRFDAADTLVFRVVLFNKTTRPIRYLPQSLMVRTGERVLFQSITDGTGEMPPQIGVPVYFAITGTPMGGRNEVSPRNDFMVLLQRLENPPPVSTTNHLSAIARPVPTHPFAPVGQRVVTPASWSYKPAPPETARAPRASVAMPMPAPISYVAAAPIESRPLPTDPEPRFKLSFFNFSIFYHHDNATP